MTRVQNLERSLYSSGIENVGITISNQIIEAGRLEYGTRNKITYINIKQLKVISQNIREVI